MKTVTIAAGRFFKPKARPQELKAELTPAFSKIIEAFQRKAIEERLASPGYFFEVTYLERGGPLELFLKRVLDGLRRPGPTILPLRTGFGFGKTHAEILLLHSTLSAEELPERAKDALRNAGWDEELARNTLVLPVDFYAVEQHPVAFLRNILRAYTSKTTCFWRDEIVERRVKERDFDGVEVSSDFAREVVGLARACDAPLLVIVDELGWGFRKRVEDYVQGKDFASLSQITWLTSFLSNLAGRSEREGVPLVIVYAFAEQDERVIEYYAEVNEDVRNYWGIAKVDLFEKLARYTGGVTATALGLNPDDMIKIATFRTISPLEAVDKAGIARTLANLVVTFTEFGDRAGVEGLLGSYYPLSPFMVYALRKLARLEDLPGTEFVRSAIYLLAQAAERALDRDWHSPTIDIKHLELEEACFLGNLGDVQKDWAGLVTELATAIKGASENLIEACEHVAKVVLSKGATSRILTLLRIEDKSQAKKYGTTLEELQLATLLTSRLEEASEALGLTKRAVDYLLGTSSSIEERRIEDATFLFPAITGTILSKLRDFEFEERARLSREPIDYLRTSRLLSLITSNLGSEKASIFLADLGQVEDPEELVKLAGSALSEPRPGIVLLNPHDRALAQRVQRDGYSVVVSDIAARLNEEAFVKAVSRPLYLVLLVPNLSRERLKPLLESLATYEAAEKFLSYLREEEEVVDELVSRITTLDAVKRLKLSPRELRKSIAEKVKKEIGVARDVAERNKLRSAREAAKRFIALYGVVAYDLKSKKFASVDVERLFARATERVEEVRDPKMCADGLNAFIDGIVETRFVSSVDKLEAIVKEYARRRVEAGQLGGVEVADVIESLIQGSFDVVPIDYGVARNAVERLSGSAFDLLDKSVTAVVSEERIRFEVAEKVPEPTLPSYPPPAPPVVEKINELELFGVPSTEILGLRGVVKSLEGEIDTLVISLREKDGRSLGTIAIRKKFADTIGPLTALARILDAEGDFRILLKTSKDKDGVTSLLGPLREYWKPSGA